MTKLELFELKARGDIMKRFLEMTMAMNMLRTLKASNRVQATYSNGYAPATVSDALVTVNEWELVQYDESGAEVGRRIDKLSDCYKASLAITYDEMRRWLISDYQHQDFLVRSDADGSLLLPDFQDGPYYTTADELVRMFKSRSEMTLGIIAYVKDPAAKRFTFRLKKSLVKIDLLDETKEVRCSTLKTAETTFSFTLQEMLCCKKMIPYLAKQFKSGSKAGAKVRNEVGEDTWQRFFGEVEQDQFLLASYKIINDSIIEQTKEILSGDLKNLDNLVYIQ